MPDLWLWMEIVMIKNNKWKPFYLELIGLILFVFGLICDYLIKSGILQHYFIGNRSIITPLFKHGQT